MCNIRDRNIQRQVEFCSAPAAPMLQSNGVAASHVDCTIQLLFDWSVSTCAVRKSSEVEEHQVSGDN